MVHSIYFVYISLQKMARRYLLKVGRTFLRRSLECFTVAPCRSKTGLDIIRAILFYDNVKFLLLKAYIADDINTTYDVINNTMFCTVPKFQPVVCLYIEG